MGPLGINLTHQQHTPATGAVFLAVLVKKTAAQNRFWFLTVKIEQRIKELKLFLVEPAKPVGAYVPAVRCGDMIITSGQLPFQDQRLVFPGRVGKEVTLENAKRAARAAVMNALAAVKHVCGDLDKVTKIVRMNGYICSALSFNDQPAVLNAASDLLIDVFGEAIGQHTRCAIGVFELPLRASVEIDLTVLA
ncbi:MAG: RidA family protein [Deltaproteobacteria bacterium]|nr:RidA family protein [Deltaproteobacteria bacterium]